MKINKFNNSQSFKGVLNNKYLLKGLEKVADHSTTFIAATTLAMAVGVRPLSIALTPKVEKENKQYAIANSIASGLVKFAMVEAIALPIEKAVKNIDKNPSNYLSKETISVLKGRANNLKEAKNYKVLTQFFKLAAGFITAIPKSMITVALIPVLMKKFFKQKSNVQENKYKNLKNENVSPVFRSINKEVSFKGGYSQTLTSGISKVMNNKNIHKLISNHNFNDVNLARNMSVATDVLLTTSAVVGTMKNKKINEERKKPLIFNNIISTAITLIAGCGIDKLAQKGSKSLIDKFSEVNKNDPKLYKYIQGINIIRPTLIFAAVYYGLLPMLTTYSADKLNKFINKKEGSI